MNSYLIAFGGLLLLSGRLGDLLGRKRMFLAGIAVFTLASLACGLAAGPGMLIAARFVQGGGARHGVRRSPSGMIVRLFDPPDEQRRAIGAFAFTGAVGASAGLILGGLLVQYASWHWIFFVNLPVGAARRDRRLAGAGRGPGHRAARRARTRSARRSSPSASCSPSSPSPRPRHWWAGLVAVALLAGVRRPPGHRADAAAPAARARLPQRVRRQPRPVAHHRRRDGLPGDRHPVHAAGARLPPGRRRASGCFRSPR